MISSINRLFTFIFLIISVAGSSFPFSPDSLNVHYKGDAQVEVGNHYLGIELHHNSPSLQRISFYYPAANSIDLSNDYWKRDSSFIMSLGLKIGNDPIEWLNQKHFQFDLTPYNVFFSGKEKNADIKISYEFCKSKPAMAVRYSITNTGRQTDTFSFYTDLETSLKTSHSYKIKDKAVTEYSGTGNSIYTNFDDRETMNTQIFVGNAGEKPIRFSGRSILDSIPVKENNWWNKTDMDLSDNLISAAKQGIPSARFLYQKKLAPNEKMEIIQLIGSCKTGEAEGIVKYLLKNYKAEVNDFNNYVNNEINKSSFKTGDKEIDQTVKWSKAILAVNQHYIDGKIEPMPCPAEYNFYFTHDVLLTDLAAVNFDLERVKQDLQFITDHADKNSVIPHAYYWKDTAFVTEFADPNNWNNFWLIIVASSYLRHSSDSTFIRKIYPYLTKSLEQTLMNKKDNLIWAYRPDWWDIGHIYGPRAYMTILAIKSIRDYIYTSVVLNQNLDKLRDYEKTADEMEKELNKTLWKEDTNYLMNYYEPAKIDPHYYIGSLLAPHFDLLNSKRTEQLVKTAQQKLLDPKLGIYVVFPMDFQSLIDYMKFHGNEAGDKFYYLNGGIWSNGNAWYVLDLIKSGKKKEALEFIKKIMTISGMLNSPNGQPAMYEVRNGNFNDPKVYGKIDKPQFMWAAGWYLYCLYYLYGIDENSWNISFNPFLDPKDSKECSYSLFASGKNLDVVLNGEGDLLNSIEYNGKSNYSLVIPGKMLTSADVELKLGKLKSPYLRSANSILQNFSYDEKTRRMDLELKAFPDHKTEMEIISPSKPKTVYLNGKVLTKGWQQNKELLKIDFSHQNSIDQLSIQF